MWKWFQDHLDSLPLSADRVRELRAGSTTIENLLLWFYFIIKINDTLSDTMLYQVFNLSFNSGKLSRWENYSEPGLDFPSSPRRYSPTTQVQLLLSVFSFLFSSCSSWTNTNYHIFSFHFLTWVLVRRRRPWKELRKGCWWGTWGSTWSLCSPSRTLWPSWRPSTVSPTSTLTSSSRLSANSALPTAPASSTQAWRRTRTVTSSTSTSCTPATASPSQPRLLLWNATLSLCLLDGTPPPRSPFSTRTSSNSHLTRILARSSSLLLRPAKAAKSWAARMWKWWQRRSRTSWPDLHLSCCKKASRRRLSLRTFIIRRNPCWKLPRGVWQARLESTVHSKGPSLDLERLPTTGLSPTSFMPCSRKRPAQRHNFLLLNLQISWWIGWAVKFFDPIWFQSSLCPQTVEGQTKLPAEDLESSAGHKKIVKQMEPSSGHIRS